MSYFENYEISADELSSGISTSLIINHFIFKMDSKIIYIEYRGDISSKNRFGVKIYGDKSDFMTPIDFINYFRLNLDNEFKGVIIEIFYGGIPLEEVHLVKNFKKDLEEILAKEI